MVVIKVEFWVPSISHLISMATVVVLFGKKRVEGKKLNFVTLRFLKTLKLLWLDNNFLSLGPLSKTRDTRLQFFSLYL